VSASAAVTGPRSPLPSAPVRVAALARLEAGEVLRSRWLLFCGWLYAALALLFVFVGARESGVLGFTGMARVLLSVSHALVVLLPLLALTGTGLAVTRARRDGTLELLFSHPITRDDYVGALTIVRFGALLLPLLVLVPALAGVGALGFHQPVPWAFLARALAVSAALLWAFTGIGLAVSARVAEPDRAMMYLLLAWVVGVALADFGLVGIMLQWDLPAAAVFTLAAVNPVETARLALLSGAEPTLGTLGPVGYFLHDSLGPTWLLVLGTLWPVTVGSLGWVVARRRLRAGDLV
jgi:ABC-type transport system involved in multi-copper enzyme maturation permease subunit